MSEPAFVEDTTVCVVLFAFSGFFGFYPVAFVLDDAGLVVFCAFAFVLWFFLGFYGFFIGEKKVTLSLTQ